MLVSHWHSLLLLSLEGVACLQCMQSWSLAFLSASLGGWQQAGEQPSAACSWSFSLSGIWWCLEDALCSEHLPSGQAGSPRCLSVSRQLCWGDTAGVLHTAARPGPQKGLQDAQRDKTTSCVTSKVNNDLNDWVPSSVHRSSSYPNGKPGRRNLISNSEWLLG